MASQDSLALELYRETDRTQRAHNILWQQFLDYLYSMKYARSSSGYDMLG